MRTWNETSISFDYIVESLDIWHGGIKQMNLAPNLTNQEYLKGEKCVEAKHFKNFQIVEKSLGLLEVIHNGLENKFLDYNKLLKNGIKFLIRLRLWFLTYFL